MQIPDPDRALQARIQQLQAGDDETGDGKVGPCGDGDAFCGVALEVNDGLALVQLKGFVRVSCGDAVAVGYTKLSANAGGGVKTNASGTAYLVVEAGSTEKQTTILL